MATAFAAFRDRVIDMNLAWDDSIWPHELLMREKGDWATYYAPFDHINQAARIVLVGITPGLQQAGNGLRSLQLNLRSGMPDAQALEVAKNFASFSGSMRQNLIDMLDAIGIPDLLVVNSAAELFGTRKDLVHYASALRYPVTYKGKNFSGTPSIASSPYATQELMQWFAPEAKALPDAVFVPLGPAVSEAVSVLVSKEYLGREQVLDGLPHPSGANAERIAYFCGRKERASLSVKTNPERLDFARERLRQLVDRLRALKGLPTSGPTGGQSGPVY